MTEPLAEDPSSDGEDTPTGVEELAAPAVTAALCLLERLQTIRVVFSSKPQHDSTSNRSQKKLWCTIQNQDQRHQRARSCPCQFRPCTVFCSIRAALAPVFNGQFRTFLQTWPKKKWQSSSSATTVACARQVQTDLSFVVASLSKFHHLHSDWVK